MKKLITLLFVLLVSMTNLVMARTYAVVYEEDLPIYYIVDEDSMNATAVSSYEYVDQYPREDLYFRDEVEYNGKLYPVTCISNRNSYNYREFLIRGIKSLRLPTHLQTIKGDPFYECNLNELVIPSEVVEVDGSAFNHGQINRILNLSRKLISTVFIDNCKRPYPRLIDVDTLCVGDGFKYYIYGDIKCIYEMDEASHIDIPEGYHYDRALFKDCKKLESVTLPTELDSIPMEFFSGCEQLKVINGLERVKTIGAEAFRHCYAFESISLPMVEKIGDHAFADCKGLTEVNFGESLTEICDYSFQDCSLKELILPQSVKSLGISAFGYNDFQECVLPESITSIGGWLFRSCHQLTTVIISENYTVIPKYMFYDCIKLKDFVLPNNVVSIEDGAFHSCRSLNTIVLPKTVKELGNRAFMSCESLCLLKCEATVPPMANNSTFSYIPYYKCEVRVPEESVEDYRNADGWWNFRLWNEEWTGAIEEISLDEAVPSPAFDLMGRPTGSKDKGLRILRQGNTTRKVLIR